ncbi:MauE/DoxX family redox-associated membrane protein [Sphingobacterium psychroaquaticum]|uniref:Methylamine utilisation protein MauE n=1 Tax=Sphingobacterium psychroaquaticum TaxID=561061 RepID=A0A1X7IL58_9SPHI|nr:hypothetical protein E2P86_09660 [Sphingobacterium psychroaquaticum]SMG15545.1 Methylamine utilisation protein MauE [Sphingobacterium psychroaquaticum]
MIYKDGRFDNKEGQLIRRKILSFIVYGASLLLSIFFIYTGTYKILHAKLFEFNAQRISLFPSFIIPYLAYLIALVEFIVAILLIIKPLVGHMLFASIMLLFSVYIVYLNYNQLYEVCGCGGILNGLEYSSHLVLNVSLLTISLLLIHYFVSEDKRVL